MVSAAYTRILDVRFGSLRSGYDNQLEIVLIES